MCVGDGSQFNHAGSAAVPLILRLGLLCRPDFRAQIEDTVSALADGAATGRLTPPQWDVFLALATDDLNAKATIVADLHPRLRHSKSTLGRALKTLRAKGLVRTGPDPVDRRRHRIAITPPFRAVIEHYVRDCARDLSDLIDRHDQRERGQAETFLPPDGTVARMAGTNQDVTRSKGAEAALRESEERFRSFTDHAPAKIHIKDINGRYLMLNPRSEELFGRAAKDVIGRKASDIFPGTMGSAFDAHDREVIETGRAVEREEKFYFDGQMRTYLTVKFPIRDANGTIVAIGSNGTDITERKWIEAEMLAAQEKLHAAIDALGEGFAVFDADDRLVHCNDRYRETYRDIADVIVPGTTFETIIRTGAERGLVPEAEGRTEAWVAKRMAAHRAPGPAVEQRLINGRCLRIAERRLSDGGTVGFRIDITELKQAEENLKRANEALEVRVEERTRALNAEITERRQIEAELMNRTELVELLYAVSSIVNEASDADAAMAACLKAVCDYAAWPVGHLYSLSNSVPPVLTPSAIWYLEDPAWFANFHDVTMATTFEVGAGLPGRVLETGRPTWIEDLNADHNFPRLRDRKDLVVQAGFAFPIKVKGDVVGVMEFFSPFVQKSDPALLFAIERIGDQLGRLVERETAERALRDAMARADQANRAKSDFLAAMSHELRTPLNAILGFSELLRSDPAAPLNQEQREFADHIHAGGGHLLELINEVLDLAKIESGKQSLAIAPVAIDDILTPCLRMAETMAASHDVTLIHEAAPAPLPAVSADATRVRQALLNFLSNAIKYNRPGGRVLVSCLATGSGAVRFSVSDTGPGIPEDMLPRLFVPFDRLDQAHGDIEGTGIGLAIVKQLISRMGGEVGVDSTVGRGTTFWFDLPRAERTPRAAQASRDDAAPARRPDLAQAAERATKSIMRSRTVLYIEDNPANVRLMEMIVGKIPNLTLRTADTAERGLADLRTVRPALVLMDINLPGMSGTEACRRMRADEETAHIPIVAISADARLLLDSDVAEAGFERHITKPFRIGDILGAIGDILGTPPPSDPPHSH